ncbi:hypothetical protein QUB00_34540 [Microcoleus sp. F8_C2]
MAEPGHDRAGYFLVLGGLVKSHELLAIGQKLTIDYSVSANGKSPILWGLMMYTSQLTIQESKI